MTTWHDNETIHDVIGFALMNTNFDFHKFHDYLALMIGTNPEIESELIAAIQNQLVRAMRVRTRRSTRAADSWHGLSWVVPHNHALHLTGRH